MPTLNDIDRKKAVKLIAAIMGLLTALLALLQGEPELPPLPFTEIVSDDGVSKAWLIDQPGAYVLDRDLDAAETAFFVTAAGDVSLDLGGHTVTFGSSGKAGCVGVNPWKAPSSHLGFGENDKRFATVLPAASWKSRTLSIRNGTIRHTGPPEAAYACCVGGDYTYNVVLSGVTLEASGVDAACVSAGNVVMSDCRSVNASMATTNRHQVPANVRADHLVARHNVLIGGNSGFFVGGGTATIEGNVIRQHSFATNGYGVMLFRCRAVLVSGNLIAPTNGRGVMDNGPHELGNREPVIIRDNVIIARERPNAEFGSDLQATCIRSRYAGDNLQVTGNRCLAIGGGEYTAGVGIYLTHRPGSSTNIISGNEFAAVLTSDVVLEKNHWAAPLGLIGNGEFANDAAKDSVCPDVIRENRLVTNHFAFALSHTDGGCNQDVHCASVEFAGGREIVDRFARTVEGRGVRGEGREEAEIVADLRGIPVSGSPPRTWIYAGRYKGSRAKIVVDRVSGGDGVADVLRVSNRYAYDVELRLGP